MTGRLEGKIAVITGGSRGIGAAITESFAREGARVVIASRKPEGLEATAEQINQKYENAVWAKPCHIGHPQEIEELIAWTEKELGIPNILVNNAGTNPHFGPLMDVTPALWEKTFEVNLRGYFETTRQVVKRWQEHKQKGNIINVASVAGISAAPAQGVYGMTKAAVISMTKTLAVELGPLEIRVNVIAPGLVNTRLSGVLIQTPELTKLFTDHTALRRYAEPQEMAGLAVYLASEESSYVTGQTFCVDGGYTIA